RSHRFLTFHHHQTTAQIGRSLFWQIGHEVGSLAWPHRPENSFHFFVRQKRQHLRRLSRFHRREHPRHLFHRRCLCCRINRRLVGTRRRGCRARLCRQQRLCLSCHGARIGLRG